MFDRIPPHIVFNDAPGNGGGDTPTPPTPSAPLGFPPNTPVDDMNDEQKAAYWRHESKKHQKEAQEWAKLGERSTIAQTLKDAEDARQAALTETDRKVEAARAEGRTEGAQTHLRSAVEGRLIALTRGSGESYDDAETRVSNALAFADVTRFVTDGNLDASKVQTFASSLASGVGDGEQGPIGDLLHRVLGGAASPGAPSGGSVAAYQEVVQARLTPSTT